MVTDEEFQALKGMVESIMPYFEQAPPPDDVAEKSVPVVNQAVNMDDWASIFLAVGDGILDDDGGPYYVSEVNDQTNEITIRVSTESGKARAFLHGHYHVMTEDMQVSIPAVSSPTTYHVGLLYDPLLNDPAGHVKLTAWPAGTLTQGKRGLTMYVIPRNPSQLLSTAWGNRTNMRRMIASTQTTGNKDSLPPFDDVLWGTEIRTLDTGHVWRADSSGWINTSDSGWQAIDLWPEQKWVGHGLRPEYKVTGNRIDFRGRVARTNGSNFTAGRSEGWGLGTIPYDARNHSAITGSGTELIKLSVSAGELRIYTSRDARWLDLGSAVAWLD